MLLWKQEVAGVWVTKLNCFNPCSLGCCSESGIGAGVYDRLCEVSILVLLDVALKALMAAIARGFLRCFNPCSLGCCSESRIGSSTFTICEWGFNPCSLGCCSESPRLVGIWADHPQFQSLFSWMLLWKSWYNVWTRHRQDVSILVLLDVALKVGYEPHQ